MKGKLCVISGPSGTGKTTLVKRLCEEYPLKVRQSVSCTTRKPRIGEVEGVDYFFISEKEFCERIEAGEFLEYAKVFGNYYGTLKAHVEDLVNKQFAVLLVIDVQGAKQMRNCCPGDYIFLSPPSMVELERRIRMRRKDTEPHIQERLKLAIEEMRERHCYDRVIVNDDVDRAYKELTEIIIWEKNQN